MALDASKIAYAVAFVVFAGVIYRFAGSKIVGMLDTYSASIRKQLDEARTLRDDAQVLLASYQRQQHEMQLEAQNMLERARTEAAAFRQEALAELERDLARREQAALDRIALGAARARQEVQAAAVTTVMITLEALLRERPAQANADHLIRLAEQTPIFPPLAPAGAPSRSKKLLQAAAEFSQAS
jgi:F-type H+-transporting ATPase subunit b